MVDRIGCTAMVFGPNWTQSKKSHKLPSCKNPKMKQVLILISILFTAIPCFTQSIPSYIPSDGLIGWWPFNGNANDESGNGNDGTVNGAVLTEDRFGNANSAYSFDGVISEIEFTQGTETSLNNTGDISFSFYIKTTQTNTGIIVSFGDHNLESGGGYLAALDIYNPNSQQSGYLNYHTNGSWGNSTAEVNDNQWHSIIIIQRNDTLSLFIDGILNSFLTNIAPINSWNGKRKLGVRNDIEIEYYHGLIDDFCIWNRALTANEIQNLYNSNLNTSTCNPLPNNLQNGLVGYWPFCGNADDESGNGNDGTVNGAVLTEDRFGNASSAYSFDGTNDLIELNSNDFCFNENAIALSFWTNVVVWTDNGGFLQAPIIQEGGNHIYHNQFGPQQSSESILISYQFQNRVYEATVPFNNFNFIGTWNHFLFTKDNSNNYTIYLNGIQLTSTNSYDYGNSTCNGILVWGREINPNGEFFYNGKLDDIGIWNRALSSDEVQQLYTLNACTFTIYDTVTVTEIVYDTVSVSTTDTLIIETLITSIEPAQENTFLVYPNPANTQITINNGNFGILSGYELKITNSLGQDVYNSEITQQEVTLDISTWGGNGLYILYIQEPNGNTIAVKQIVLQ